MKMRSLYRMLAVLTAVPTIAAAGYTYQAAGCAKYTDGSGYCYGNFLGFRNSAGSWDSAYFSYTASYSYFSGTYGSANVYCTPNATVAPLWPTATLHRGYFYVTWNSAGTCDYLNLVNGSPYSTF